MCAKCGCTTRLIGAADSGPLRLKSGIGEAEIPFDQVTAIEGGNRQRRDGARVFLADGQVFSGDVNAVGLSFVMASGGSMDLDVSRMDRLVRAARNDEGEWAETTSALLETFNGDRIAVQDGGAVVICGHDAKQWDELKHGADAYE